MRFGPNSGARKVWYCKRKTQKCHLRFCGTVNKKGYSFRKGVPLSGQNQNLSVVFLWSNEKSPWFLPRRFPFWWTQSGSNRRPYGCEPYALAMWCVFCPRTAVYGLMKMMDEEQMQETLPPSFSIRREWTASLYAEKTKGYFFTMTNSLLTRENGLVYNGNNS